MKVVEIVKMVIVVLFAVSIRWFSLFPDEVLDTADVQALITKVFEAASINDLHMMALHTSRITKGRKESKIIFCHGLM